MTVSSKRGPLEEASSLESDLKSRGVEGLLVGYDQENTLQIVRCCTSVRLLCILCASTEFEAPSRRNCPRTLLRRDAWPAEAHRWDSIELRPLYQTFRRLWRGA